VCLQVHALNRHHDYVTTSSCSGRTVLFESAAGSKREGRWLLVEHREVTVDELLLAVEGAHTQCSSSSGPHEDVDNTRACETLVTFKLEPPILHVLCRNLDSAKALLAMAVRCGFRESGITLSSSGKVMLGIRSTANTFELPFAHRRISNRLGSLDAAQGDEEVPYDERPRSCGLVASLLVPDSYIELLVRLSNEKFVANQRRTDALYAAFLAFGQHHGEDGTCGTCEERPERPSPMQKGENGG